MPLRLFASRERAGAYAGRLLFLGGMLSFWFFVTQYLQGVLGYSPLETGLRVPARPRWSTSPSRSPCPG